MCDALDGCTEHQGEGTPHFHGFLRLVTAYQHRSLWEITKAIESDFLTADAIKDFVEHVHQQEHFDDKRHQAQPAACTHFRW